YNKPIEIKIYVDTFEKITLSDSTEAYLSEESKPLTAEKLEINLSGSSKLNFRMSTDKLDLKLSGSSELNLVGYTKELNADLSGSSNLTGTDLESEKVKIKMSGSSKAKIYVKEDLDAKLSGSSMLEYGGD